MYPKAYIDYLVHFHGDRDYFECHEILEEYWKDTEPEKRQQVWVALIQIAVAMYHHRRENWNGAERMLQKAISLVKKEQHSIKQLGLDNHELPLLLIKRLEEIKQRMPYKSINLPIQDQSLLEECKLVCKKQGLGWGNTSNLSDLFLLHKHKLRDRSEVIEARRKQMMLKAQKRKG